jgi:hypothetical protein
VRTALRRHLSTLLLRKCRLRRTAGGTRFDDLAASRRNCRVVQSTL